MVLQEVLDVKLFVKEDSLLSIIWKFTVLKLAINSPFTD